MCLRALIGKLATIFILVANLLIISPTPPVYAQEIAAAPKSCLLGAYLNSLYNLDLNQNNFGASFWLWSNCDSENLQPLQTAELVNANSSSYSQEGKDKKGNILWEYRKINGVFRHEWNLRNYPFDRQILEIWLDETEQDTNSFVYIPDKINSGYNKNIKIDGWQIIGLNVEAREVRYDSTLGNPQVAGDVGSNYSRLIVSIEIARTDRSGFWKMTIGAYIAFAISALTFLFDPNQRTILLIGSLLAVLLSLISVDGILGSTEGLSSIDLVHITTMIYIFVAASYAVYSQILHKTGREKTLRRFDRIGMIVFVLSFLVANIVLIGTTAFKG
ncbi:MAG TPA: hypothetical protein V6D28_20585 [Leptolyngbyaceae cyanobacterium]